MNRLVSVIVLIMTIGVGCDLKNGSDQPIPAVEPRPDPSAIIRLVSRTFQPKPGLDDRLIDYIKTRKEERIHVIIQFEKVPSLEQRGVMEKQFGTRVLDTIPERAFFAAIRRDLSTAKAILDGKPRAKWIGFIEPTDKVAPQFRAGRVPGYTRREGELAEFIIQFFADVNPKLQREFLEKAGAKIEVRMDPINGWRILHNEQKALELAKDDIVKWIEPGPPPPEEDNDGVRSASGVNSDAIRPAPYGLTGTGVVVGQWEGTNASLTHGDFAGRIILGDAPIPAFTRSTTHDESINANGQFDPGEGVYVDLDDSQTVTAGDLRNVPVAGFAAGTIVAVGNVDIGIPLIFFQVLERFADVAPADLLYSAGEAAYLDADNSLQVSAGDTRRTATAGFAAGSVVAAGDADIGQGIQRFNTTPHFHSTHVAGTAMGSGAQSLANGGSANQWMGVASGATLRSYRVDAGVATDYPNAVANNVTISTNSWGYSHHHQVVPPNTGYGANTSYYDAVVSGRQSDGTASGLGQQVLILGSAGNRGRPERHAENVTVNGQFDAGESIYLDNDDNGTVSAADGLRSGPVQPPTTLLVNFNLNEMHDETVNTAGLYSTGEGIYRDTDGSRTVSVGDTRISAGAGFPAGSIVAAGDGDVGTFLRQFRLWGNVRIPNSAKNTIVVANIASDANTPSRSSSRGPTNDGRIKPDVSGPGSDNGADGGVTSTWPGNSYSSIAGTSMSTPAVSGSAALATEWYRSGCLAAGATPATLRALFVHTAEDLTAIPNIPGTFTGPDFTYGYGRVRVEEAVALVPHHRTATANALGIIDYTVTLGAVQDLKVTLAWDDPAWAANAAPSAATGMLQNDLDLLLIAPDGTQYTPWVLNPANPFAPATKTSVGAGTAVPVAAQDHLNTIEQVVVDNALAGTWTIRVTASTLNQPPQTYVLVSEALPPQDSPCTGIPAADVWMQDNAADDGTVPSSGRMWLSPDLWNRLADDGMTGHQDPEFGQPNYLYANIRNRSTTQTAVATTMEVWLAPAAVGLAWPDNFQLAGYISVANLAPGETRVVGPLEWDPPPPSPSDHFCFYVRVTSPQDPITFAETSAVGNNTRNSNNIIWRNINIVDLVSSRSVTFVARNFKQKEVSIDLVIDIPPELLEVGSVMLQLDPALENRWKNRQKLPEGIKAGPEVQVFPWIGEWRQYVGRQPVEEDEPRVFGEPKEKPTMVYRITKPRVVFKDIVFAPKQAGPVKITFGSAQKKKAIYEIHIIERINNEEVGGILYQVRTGYRQEEARRRGSGLAIIQCFSCKLPF